MYARQAMITKYLQLISSIFVAVNFIVNMIFNFIVWFRCIIINHFQWIQMIWYKNSKWLQLKPIGRLLLTNLIHRNVDIKEFEKWNYLSTWHAFTSFCSKNDFYSDKTCSNAVRSVKYKPVKHNIMQIYIYIIVTWLHQLQFLCHQM